MLKASKICLSLIMALSLGLFTNFANIANAEEGSKDLIMATTTSTADTGLLDYLAELFLADTGYNLKYTAVGTGAALKMGEGGDADIVFVHAKASEEKFVKDGFGVKRVPVMYNDFVVVGPAKPINKTNSIKTFFTDVHKRKANFISRGDKSGTDTKEKSIWSNLKINTKQNRNYKESGQGMGATLTMANETNAYALTDRGTWLKMSNDASTPMEIDIVCEGDTGLFNQYGIIAVNPEKYPDTNITAANAFIDWIVSEKVQKQIAMFGVGKYGQSLFIPNAGTDN